MIVSLLRSYQVPLGLGLAGVLLIALSFAVYFHSSNEAERGVVVVSSVGESQYDESNWMVDIQGAVEFPGVYTVSENERVSDLVFRSGGLRDDADHAWIARHLNMARLLSDGAKIYIPFEGEEDIDVIAQTGGDVSLTESGGLIDINTAAASELEELSGVGEKTAQKIVDGRPYQQIEELLEKKIVGPATFEKIKDNIVIF